jgi:hypothetical protein
MAVTNLSDPTLQHTHQFEPFADKTEVYVLTLQNTPYGYSPVISNKQLQQLTPTFCQ